MYHVRLNLYSLAQILLHFFLAQMYPLSPILQCANLFAEQVLSDAHHTGLPGVQAIQYLERVYPNRIDPLCLTALKKIFPTQK